MKTKTRLAFFFYLLSIFILVDEYIAEGYILDPIDIINPQVTHEKLFLVFLIIAITLSIRGRK